MNIDFKQTLAINAKIGSSESIMFMKGGKQSINLSDELRIGGVGKDLTRFNEVILNFQIEPSQQHRTDLITSEAKKHRAQWDEINKREAKEKNGENTKTDL